MGSVQAKMLGVVVCALVLGSLAGCATEEEKMVASIQEFPRDRLQLDAFASIVASRNDAEEEIAPKYWLGTIKDLQPSRVYVHKANLVAVLMNGDGWEEGAYIHIPASGYHPRTGDDGYEFEKVSPDVYRFRRPIP